MNCVGCLPVLGFACLVCVGCLPASPLFQETFFIDFGIISATHCRSIDERIVRHRFCDGFGIENVLELNFFLP